MNFDEYSIQFIKGVGDKRAQLFHKLGVYTLQDLIHYYPRKYIDWSKTLCKTFTLNYTFIFFKSCPQQFFTICFCVASKKIINIILKFYHLITSFLTRKPR